MCRRNGFLHLIVPKAWLSLESGQADLREYRFGTGVAQHLFCTHCGVESFYVPRSNPDGYSVHAGCLDSLPEGARIQDFDGADDYEAQVASLRALSIDPDAPGRGANT